MYTSRLGIAGCMPSAACLSFVCVVIIIMFFTSRIRTSYITDYGSKRQDLLVLVRTDATYNLARAKYSIKKRTVRLKKRKRTSKNVLRNDFLLMHEVKLVAECKKNINKYLLRISFRGPGGHTVYYDNNDINNNNNDIRTHQTT